MSQHADADIFQTMQPFCHHPLLPSHSPLPSLFIRDHLSNLWDPSMTPPGQDGIPVHDTLGNLNNTDFFFLSSVLFVCFVSLISSYLICFPPPPLVSIPVSLTCPVLFFILHCEVAVSSTSICMRCCSTCPHL